MIRCVTCHIRGHLPALAIKFFIRRNSYITNQISKIQPENQNYHNISKYKTSLSFIRTRFLLFSYVLQWFLANNEIFQDFAAKFFWISFNTQADFERNLNKAASTLVLAENSRECLFLFSWQFVQIRLAWPSTLICEWICIFLQMII